MFCEGAVVFLSFLMLKKKERKISEPSHCLIYNDTSESDWTLRFCHAIISMLMPFLDFNAVYLSVNIFYFVLV